MFGSASKLLRERPWLSAALVFVALLFVPMTTWVFAPRVGGFVAPPTERRSGTVELEANTASVEAAPARAQSARPVATEAPLDPDEDRDKPGITGKVVDPDGKPVAGASIICNEPTPLSHFASTNGEGRFKITLAAEGCKVIARQDGFSASEETRIDNGRDNEIRLRAPGGIDGVVVDERGGPVSPVMVAVESFTPIPSGSDIGAVLDRGAKSFDARNGAFTLDHLAAGKYVLTATADGRPPVQSAEIDVDFGRTQRGVRITLARGGKIAGKVIDEQSKKPIAGAVVALESGTQSQANATKSATSDDRGAFLLESAPAGPFSIRVAHADYVTKSLGGLTTVPGGQATDVQVELTALSDGGVAPTAGIGARISQLADDKVFFVMLPGSPIMLAGVRPGAVLLKIDGVDASGLSLADCNDRLRGAPGTSVSLTIKRDSEQSVISVNRVEGM